MFSKNCSPKTRNHCENIKSAQKNVSPDNRLQITAVQMRADADAAPPPKASEVNGAQAAAVYREQVEAAGGVFSNSSEYRAAFAQIESMAAAVAEKRGESVIGVLQSWGVAYFAARTRRAPPWWIEWVDRECSGGAVAPVERRAAPRDGGASFERKRA